AGAFQHTQCTLVGFVSGLLSLLSGLQSLVGLAVSLVGASLSTGCGVFGSGQTSFAFLGHAVAATSGQNGGESQSRKFQNVVHRVPLKDEIHGHFRCGKLARTYYLLVTLSKLSQSKGLRVFQRLDWPETA